MELHVCHLMAEGTTKKGHFQEHKTNYLTLVWQQEISLSRLVEVFLCSGSAAFCVLIPPAIPPAAGTAASALAAAAANGAAAAARPVPTSAAGDSSSKGHSSSGNGAAPSSSGRFDPLLPAGGPQPGASALLAGRAGQPKCFPDLALMQFEQ